MHPRNFLRNPPFLKRMEEAAYCIGFAEQSLAETKPSTKKKMFPSQNIVEHTDFFFCQRIARENLSNVLHIFLPTFFFPFIF